MKKNADDPKKLTLKRSTFMYLVLITVAALLIFYASGLSINAIGLRNAYQDLQEMQQMRTQYAADQTKLELERLHFFTQELLSQKELLRYAITYPILEDYERLSAVRALSAQEYMIKRSSALVDSISIMLPSLGRTIVTDQALYTEMDAEMWQALLKKTVRESVVLTEWNHQLYMITARYDQGNPLFLIAISLSTQELMQKLLDAYGEHPDTLTILRADGSVFSSSGDTLLDSAEVTSSEYFMAESELSWMGLRLFTCSRVNRKLEPFVHSRQTQWLLSILALFLMAAYLLYYQYSIRRPVEDILRMMQEYGKDGQYRIERTSGTNDDMYAQFNELLGHVETLAAQVYEEQYRAQKAELKQLQIQIEPHFLYNTLYLIYRMAQSEGNANISALSLNLSNYYRYITKMPEQIVPLRKEIAHVMNYLEIQRIRFEPRIHVLTEPLPPEIADERIPSLIIQPIVENAFQHGVRDMVSDGIVSMRYQVEPDFFQVIVADNSGKMTEEQVQVLWESIRGSEEQEVNALRNLYRRLQLYEESGQALTLQSVDNGLTAILTFRRRACAFTEVTEDC